MVGHGLDLVLLIGMADETKGRVSERTQNSSRGFPAGNYREFTTESFPEMCCLRSFTSVYGFERATFHKQFQFNIVEESLYTRKLSAFILEMPNTCSFNKTD